MQSSKDFFLSLSLSVHHPRQIQISTTLNNNNNFFLFAFGFGWFAKLTNKPSTQKKKVLQSTFIRETEKERRFIFNLLLSFCF